MGLITVIPDMLKHNLRLDTQIFLAGNTEFSATRLANERVLAHR